ncbi:DotG/IcmE/VirB10 family protein [Brucella intermedia]|uniref:DotG/IcmE/VirB10 family protein n=1 Tax=Brucella intermedia TaxID=94625 RepID=UPI00235FECD5|nr:DotG/IcmE/VirB10 family protein [Brucella intermedia]
MANMKTIALVSGGVVVAFVAIIGMNMAASNKDDESFAGGVSQQRLPRQLPESNADPFQVIADEDEAAKRATSNKRVADEEIRKVGEVVPAYTAPPVIQLEGSSGDSSDPMASALVDQRDRPTELEQAKIEPVKPAKREYKVPESTARAPASSGNPLEDELIRRALIGTRSYGVSIQTFSNNDDRGYSPMTIQQFSTGRGSRNEQGAGNAGLPVSRLPDPVPSMKNADTVHPNPASQITLPEQPSARPSGNTSGGVLRTIDPNTPSSYFEGALQDAIGNNVFAALSKEHDAEYDWRQPYQVAQSAIGIDNNSRIYDTARNAQAFDAGTLILPGDQRFATLMYGFNSDDAAQLPVFAQLHDYGPASSAFLNGARVQGTLRLSKESAVMEFNKLILRDGRVVPIQAMGISQDQLRVGVFKDVNRHVFERYSSLLVSGLISGVGEVGTRIIDNRFGNNRSGSTTIIIGDDNTDGRNRDKFTSDDWAGIGMGAAKPIGDALSSAAAEGFSRKPTITAPVGFGFSIVFLDGLTYGQVQ